MKSPSLLLPWAALLSSATAQIGYLYTIDRNQYPSKQITIDSDMASSITLRRRGMAQSENLRTTDDGAVYQIASFGGYQRPLFSSADEKAPSKIFIVYRDTKEDFQRLSTAQPNLRIVKPDTDVVGGAFSPSATYDHGTCGQTLDSIKIGDNSNIEWFASYSMDTKEQCRKSSAYDIIPDLVNIKSALTEASTHFPEAMETVVSTLKTLQKDHDIESTILILPPVLATPSRNHKLHVRAEDLLDDLPETDRPAFDPTHISPSFKTLASNHTLPSIIPVCFSSQSLCENSTNFCSGHGSCYKRTNNCYKCKCGTTLARYNPDGTKKTVQWGGNACQKKDISAPFILFATFGVVMAALVAGSIGMLFSMGNQELPSVIGAGVAGPRAQK